MPRTYKPDPRSKRYQKYDVDIVARAIAVVQRGLSIRKAAAEFKIPYTVLQRRIKNGPNVKKHGGQTVLTETEENAIVSKLQMCAEWGYPLDMYGLRLIIKLYLDRLGKTIPKFKDNKPGKEFAYGFMKRHKDKLAVRLCQNIKRARAGVSPEVINDYFNNLEDSLRDIPASHIINYDETNLSNDPGRNKIIAKRGCKYPERVMNQTKSAVSIMFAAAGDGKMLPCYVVYKAKNVYSTWVEGGPKYTRYNATISGWFDNMTFTDWLKTIAIPYLQKLDGEKVLIGDNLSSHLSEEVISLCVQHNIRFIFLPGNSTHLTQPLDIAFFRPLKVAWRKILRDWKQGPGMKEPSVPKSIFPRLLTKLIKEIEPNAANNVRSGFCKAGLVPINRDKVLSMIPKVGGNMGVQTITNNLDESFCDLLKQMRYGDSDLKKKKSGKKINIQAGKSVRHEKSSDSESGSENHEDIELSSSEAENNDLSDNSPIESEEEEPNLETSSSVENVVVRHGKTFENVSAVIQDAIKIDDWLLVGFPTETKKASSSCSLRFYLCQVVNKTATEVSGNFLREKQTRDFLGNVFQFPDKQEISEFPFDQVVGKVEPPVKYLRGYLKFSVNFLKF